MTLRATLPLAALLIAAALTACGGDDDTEITPTFTASASPAATPTASTTATPTDQPPTATPAPTTGPPTSGPTDPPSPGPGLLTLVDKDHGLPADYVPPSLVSIPSAYLAPGFGGRLRQAANDALVSLLDAAYEDGHDIRCRSAYRSYAEQESTFQYWVDVLGYEEAVRVSAMPGHSEHQLGTTCDLTSPEVGWDLITEFGDTASGRWLADHAHEYGFALSYPEGKEDITGYSYEPWHWRYIGPAEAQAWKNSGLTLNQYLTQ